ncbi:MAG: pectate lyase [Opitutus sp.]
MPSITTSRHCPAQARVLRVLSLFLTLTVLTAVSLHAAAQDATPLPRQAKAALDRATAFMRSISTEGGYLWRYSPDLTQRAGEREATSTQIWVQPPGTPAMGMAFLRAYEVTGDAQYLEAAKAAANALAVGQLESGGWDYVVEFDPKLSGNWYRRTDIGKLTPAEAAKRRNVSTYDDNNTQSAIRLLLAVAAAGEGTQDPRDARIREARDYALGKLLEVQRPSGGWPQRWNGNPVDPKDYPVQKARFPKDYPREYTGVDYQGYYTLNDNTQRDCVTTLLDAAKILEKPEYRAAALRGGDFLLLAQLPEPQPVWAQQYNPQLEPAWARAFEPASVCSHESGGAMRLLVDLYIDTGDAKYLEPMPRAIAWFRRSEIAPDTWARMYELGTNRPIYGDRDGKIHYTVEELTPERQTGYNWRSHYNVPGVVAYYEEVKQAGRDEMLAQRKAAEEKSNTAAGKAARAKALEPRVRSAISSLDSDGRWIVEFRGSPQIRTDTFITNARLIADYLEVVR